MMNNPLGTENEEVICPYDIVHIIKRGRMQGHLMKCRRNYKNVPLVECPFNITHRINKPELDWHVQICPDRKSFENFKFTVAPNSRSIPSPVNVMPEIETTENWDDEEDVPTYDPKAYAANAPVLRLCQNAPPLERKFFRKAEHLRLKRLED
ncbi:gametocyte-specific factor 1 homolog [Episyrphus balteatus]|uniref:gametocyte-specific factor 1 homolog n=1 Tax=Episyrphus balteatus TaxID=286459 RepID=UPI0024863393|nr:gametocyte-specific factor 1 homolog [Episyrphus balteatus]